MGKSGHDRAGMGEGLAGEGRLQGATLLDERVGGVADVEPEIGRHLVVARPCRVQPAGGRADQLGEPGLDVHVDVFELAGEDEAARLDL
jgi:hypothetical protein